MSESNPPAPVIVYTPTRDPYPWEKCKKHGIKGDLCPLCQQERIGFFAQDKPKK